MLEQWRFERLILLGDVFHDWSFRHLCADTWRLLAHIRSLSQRREAEIVWVLGNHDRHLAHLVARLIGVETTETFRWSYGGRSFVALHGDRFDSFVSNYVAHRRLLFSRAYAFTQRWLSRQRRVAQAARPGACRLQQPERRRSRPVPAAMPASNAVDVIVCGHTHLRRSGRCSTAPGPSGAAIEYFNTGCWVDRPASFVTVGTGGVALNHCP